MAVVYKITYPNGKPSGSCGSRPASPRSVSSPGSCWSASTARATHAACPVTRSAFRRESWPPPNVYQAMIEPRPYRAVHSRDDAAGELRSEVRAGRLDGDAAEAVLVAAGHRARARREWPSGLTARELDVLRLVARGLSGKEIADELVISAKTARNHIEHIYAKTGATNRVTASLFAIKHGLLAAQAA